MDEQQLKIIEQYISRLDVADAKNESFLNNLSRRSDAAVSQLAKQLGISESDVKAHYDKVAGFAEQSMARAKRAAALAALDISQNLGKALKDFDIKSKEMGEKAQKAFSFAEKLSVNLAAEFNPETSRTNLRTSLGNFLGESASLIAENPVDISKAFVFRQGLEVAYDQLVPEQVKKSEKYYTDWNKSVARNIAGLTGSFADSALSGAQFGERLGVTAALGSQAMKDLGVSAEKTAEDMGSLLKAGIRLDEISELTLKVETGSVQRSVSRMSAVMQLAAGTGQQTDDVINVLYENFRKLGRGVKDTEDIMGALALTQENSGLSFIKVQNSLMQGADQLSFYGTKVEDLTGLFKSLTNSLGPARAELALPMFKNLISGISGMEDSMKGFLALTTGMGSPGGALSGILEMEDLLAEGKVDEIVDKVQEMVEQKSGGRMLTRDQAREQGREDQFFLQRRLLSQATGIRDPGELRELQNMLGGGDRIRAGELLGGGGGQEQARALSGIADEGRRAILSEEGHMRAQLNSAMSESVSAMGNFTKELDTTATMMANSMGGANGVISSLNDLVELTAGDVAYDDLTTEQMMNRAEREGFAPIAPGNQFSPLNIPNFRPGGTVSPLSIPNLRPAAQFNSVSAFNQMGMSPADRLNSAPALNQMGLGAGAYQLNIDQANEVLGSMQESRALESGAAAPQAGGSAGVTATAPGQQAVRLQASDEPIQLKISFTTDNQGRVVAGLEEGMRNIALQVVRQEVNGD